MNDRIKWKIINLIRQTRTRAKHIFFDREALKFLLKNKQIANHYAGKRCFILGNGPSLKLYDLSVLENEFVFAVNDFVRFPLVDVVKPNCYVLADPKFFELKSTDEQDRLFSEKIADLPKVSKDIMFFAPLSARKQVSEYGWDKKIDIRYFNSYTHFYDDYDQEIDFTKMVPLMQNVVQYCIMLAIYMGFTEIYMLGTDQTNIFGNLKAYMSSEISEYAYELKGDEKKWKHQKLIEHPLVDTLRGYARIFELFDELGKYARVRGIKLFNCAPETLVQGIDKFNFDEIEF